MTATATGTSARSGAADRRRLRVVHFGKFYPPHRGGMETVLAGLCRGLARRGFECRAIVAADGLAPGCSADGGVRVRRMRTFGTLNSLPLCPEAVLALGRVRADVIHFHHPNPLGDLSRLLADPAAKLVVTYHSDVVRQRSLGRLHAPLLRSTLERADAIVATSREYAASSPVLGAFRDKVHVIPLGCDPPQRPPQHRSFSGAGGRPHYLFIGRLVGYKGVGILLEALTMACGGLRIVGSGPLEGAWKALAERLGLSRRVRFLGEVSEREKQRCLAECDALVLPSVSRAEAFGLVLLEAMAAGRPVVVSDLPTGVRSLVERGANGYRFAPGDPHDLAGCLGLLAADPAHACRMGAEGRRRFLAHWTTEHMVERYAALYAKLCGTADGAQAAPTPEAACASC